MAQIICNNLSLGYNGNIVAPNISFTVNRGDYLCIVGENGSGKSTLIKALLQLIRPISGNIETGDGFIPSHTGYLPQQTEIQMDFPASVLEVVLSGYSSSKKGFFLGKEKKHSAQAIMDKLGISHLAKHSFRELSGGQQQRVFLARALCAANGVLLLDEPVSNLDPKVSNELYSILSKLNKEENMTVIMVSHDISSALKYASHILHIGQEQSVFCGADEYLSKDMWR